MKTIQEMTQEALKLALKDLKWVDNWLGEKPMSECVTKLRKAITAIKEALAQPQQKPAYRAVKTFHEGKPVYVAELSAPPTECQTEAEKTAFAFGWFKALESVRLQPPHPQQEPAAWFSTLPDGRLSIKIVGKPTDGNWEPLYTSPPQRTWVGLTDLEINSVADNSHPLDGVKDFARAIEAKLKEKNT